MKTPNLAFSKLFWKGKLMLNVDHFCSCFWDLQCIELIVIFVVNNPLATICVSKMRQKTLTNFSFDEPLETQ